MCLLGFQSICHVIKPLAWELIGEFCLVFLQPTAPKPMQPICEGPCCVYPCVFHYTSITDKPHVFPQAGRKNAEGGEVGEQSGVPSKAVVCLLQVCSVIEKIEHAAFFKQSNHIYCYIRLTHHKLFSCKGRIFNLISWTLIISQLQNCNNFLSSLF